MSRRFVIVNLALFMFFVLPQMLLNALGVYPGKLRVQMDFGVEFLVGMQCLILFVVVFLFAAYLAKIDRARIRELTEIIARRTSFQMLCLAITAICFLLLALDIGVKQTSASENFVIRFLPREIVTVAALLCAIVTRKRFWILLLAANILYWVLTGSKASLFIVVLAFLYYHTLERLPIRPAHLVWAGLALILLPFSFVVPAALRENLPLSETFGLLFGSAEFLGQTLGRIAGRVSWFDGMFLSKWDVQPLANFGFFDFLGVVLARLVPGFPPPTAPFAQQIIYLFQAAELTNFSGALGMPGMLKVMLYNHGLLVQSVIAAFIGVIFFFFFRMTRSRDPGTMIVGMTLLVVSVSGLAISGNLDSALAKLIPLMISGFVFIRVSRFVLLRRQYAAVRK